MRALALLLILGCTASNPPTGADDTADHIADDTAGVGPAVDSGQPPAARCPDDMVGVPDLDPLFCIDRYEGIDAGDGAASVAGELPRVGLPFDEARARCAATPVVDAGGASHGQKRLATLAEWRDAADGLPGPGGAAYPTGDAWPGDACAVADEDGRPIYDGLLPTGSLADCVGPFGTYDQLGNAWEWADPGLSLDLAGFMDARAAEGLLLEADSGGLINVLAGSPAALELEIAGLRGGVVLHEGALAAGSVHFQAEEPFAYRGFLIVRAAESEISADWMLPVEVFRIDGVEDAEIAPLVMLHEEDGAPVTAKVGCAWYAGTASGCSNTDRFLGHPHDFGGTIAMRCAADPF